MTPAAGAGRWWRLAAEIAGSLLLVLILFWLFILFLFAVFPSGTPIKELVESRLESAPGRYAVRQPEATLSFLFRDVRFRRGNSIAWGAASSGMQLYSQDAVQTFDRSGAGISFGARDRLSVGSNSLVVVTRLNPADEAGLKSYRVQVEGEVTGTLSAARKLRMELSAAGHTASILPGAARFKMAPGGRNSTTFAVYAGEAQVAGRNGMVRIPANHGVMLKKGVPVGRAVPLPAAPILGDGEKALYRYRLLPPKVRFNWRGAEAGGYRFQLSKEASFKECLIDEKLAKTTGFETGRLEKGTYFWRVSGVREGLEGVFSRVGRCELVQVLNSPELQVAFPPEKAAAGPYTLSGSMEPGSRVFVNGIQVASEENGKFQHELRLKSGVNLIRVEAFDATGNASYASRIVYGRSEGKGAGPKEAESKETESKGTEPKGTESKGTDGRGAVL